MKPYKIFIVVQPGLERYAQKEIEALGYKDYSVIKGGLFLYGHLSTVIKFNLACRCISRVQIELCQFEAKSFLGLIKGFSSINWKDYLTNQNLCIHCISYDSKLYHEKAITERLIDTIAEQLDRTQVIVSSPDEENTQLIIVYIKRDVVTVRLDTTGAHLHKRGYGIFKEEAPLRETVAAAALYSIGWGDKIHSLHDPMCGSGTIPLEAALMSKRTLWNSFRTFAFQKWSIFNSTIYHKIQDELKSNTYILSHFSIKASDIDEKAIFSAIQNARKGEVENMIKFTLCPLQEAIISRHSAIVSNPPWGIRMQTIDLHSIRKIFLQHAQKGFDVFVFVPSAHKNEWGSSHHTIFSTKSGDIDISFIKLLRGN